MVVKVALHLVYGLTSWFRFIRFPALACVQSFPCAMRDYYRLLPHFANHCARAATLLKWTSGPQPEQSDYSRVSHQMFWEWILSCFTLSIFPDSCQLWPWSQGGALPGPGQAVEPHLRCPEGRGQRSLHVSRPVAAAPGLPAPVVEALRQSRDASAAAGLRRHALQQRRRGAQRGRTYTAM